MKSPVGVFWFRRDLRLVDNHGLASLCKVCNQVIPVFCLDPRQLDLSKNKYCGTASIRFLFESLVDLNNQIKTVSPDSGLILFYGLPHHVLPSLVRSLKQEDKQVVVHVGWNEDVTPFSRMRDQEVTKALISLSLSEHVSKGGRVSRKQKNGMSLSKPSASHRKQHGSIHIHSCASDVTISDVMSLRTNTGKVYTVFTPFCRKVREKGIPLPLDAHDTTPKHGFLTLPKTKSPLHVIQIDTLLSTNGSATFKDVLLYNPPTEKIFKGGRSDGLKRLSKDYIRSRCQRYDKERDQSGQEHTTRLSPYLKYGCVSLREAHLSILTALHNRPTAKEALTRELVWHAFYAYITFHFPHVLQGQNTRAHSKATANEPLQERLKGKLTHVWHGGGSMKEKERRWNAWIAGKTGYPFVDAGMRQLQTTGWMHNRARMVVASFLTKHLGIDWREGERYFATRLVDYDPSSNSGGWQWASSTGADAQPYHRVFNPWLQGSKFDKDGTYVHKYVTELRDVPAADLCQWNDAKVRKKYAHVNYPDPIVDHKQARETFLKVWKSMT